MVVSLFLDLKSSVLVMETSCYRTGFFSLPLKPGSVCLPSARFWVQRGVDYTVVTGMYGQQKEKMDETEESGRLLKGRSVDRRRG